MKHLISHKFASFIPKTELNAGFQIAINHSKFYTWTKALVCTKRVTNALRTPRGKSEQRIDFTIVNTAWYAETWRHFVLRAGLAAFLSPDWLQQTIDTLWYCARDVRGMSRPIRNFVNKRNVTPGWSTTEADVENQDVWRSLRVSYWVPDVRAELYDFLSCRTVHGMTRSDFQLVNDHLTRVLRILEAQIYL